VRQISAFPLAPSNGGFKSQKRGNLSLRKSTSTDAEIEDAIRLGRSEFEKYFEFPLDDWQLQAGGSILMGHNVIVCAPTGSGKTVVGEMALHAALDRDLDGVYTTPLKALSNQKFSELREIFGNSKVGLSTGDISINRDAARLTVMTTEVYRNIAWRSSGEESDDDEEFSRNDLRKNSAVVLDEFHYMGQPGRGGKLMVMLILRVVVL
jgi:superfamily II RNA helicase